MRSTLSERFAVARARDFASESRKRAMASARNVARSRSAALPSDSRNAFLEFVVPPGLLKSSGCEAGALLVRTAALLQSSPAAGGAAGKAD